LRENHQSFIPGCGEWVPGAEQIPVNEYAKLAAQFQPGKFDPNAWAAAARDASIEGFAGFDDPSADLQR